MINSEFKNYLVFFNQFINTIEEIFTNKEFTKKYSKITKIIIKFLNKKNDKNFIKESHGLLLDYYLIL